MRRTAALLYGAICYSIFFATFLYLVGFVGNIGVPKSIDSGEPSPLGSALLVNLALIALFGVQHSVMARRGFKRWWMQFVPRPIERSTYVLLGSLLLALICWQWRPLPVAVWEVESSVGRSLLQGLFFLGIGLVLYSTFLIDHFDLFGLRQVFLYCRGKKYWDKQFVTPSLYKLIRHPLYLGWFLVFWATPSMSLGHLLFSVGMTAYILVAIPFEERDLSHYLGDEYRRYRARTPMFVPRLAGARARSARPVAESQ